MMICEKKTLGVARARLVPISGAEKLRVARSSLPGLSACGCFRLLAKLDGSNALAAMDIWQKLTWYSARCRLRSY